MINVKKLQDHANNILRILRENKSEWEERYAKYADRLFLSPSASSLPFECPGELFAYINFSTALKNCTNKTTAKYFLRYQGQNVADIEVAKKDSKVTFTTYNTNDSNFGYSTNVKKADWWSDIGEEFKEFFATYKKRIDNGRRNEEHKIQNLLFRELSKKIGIGKQLKYIQPVKLQNCFFEMPTPFKASDHTPSYSGKNGGGVDILARVRHGKSTRLGVIEVKDENNQHESIELVINQAVTYACFIRELLRSKSGQKWQKIFGYTKPITGSSGGLIIDAIAAMPNISEDDIKQLASTKRLRVAVEDDYLELHCISFSEENNDLTIQNCSWQRL
jgi:hypothetical protein